MPAALLFMEYVIIGIIIYFILQVAANLVRIWRGYGGQPGSGSFGRRNGHADRMLREDEASPRFWGRDVEDVSWEDLPEEDTNDTDKS